jgi:hypothetical protein
MPGSGPPDAADTLTAPRIHPIPATCLPRDGHVTLPHVVGTPSHGVGVRGREPRSMAEPDKERVTLNVTELANRVGISRKAASARAKRAIEAGRWIQAHRNDESGMLVFHALLSDLTPHGRSTHVGPPRGIPGGAPRDTPEPSPVEAREDGRDRALDEARRQVLDLSVRLALAEAEAARLPQTEHDLIEAKASLADALDRLQTARIESSTTAALLAEAVKNRDEARQHGADLQAKLNEAEAAAAVAVAIEAGVSGENNRLHSEMDNLNRRLALAEAQRGLFYRIFGRK